MQEVQQKNLELEKANVELMRANDLKRAFIRVASHELRTPLTIVMGLADLAKRRPRRSNRQPTARCRRTLREWVGQIHKASLRLNERVDQVVKMLWRSNSKNVWNFGRLALAKLLRGAANEVASFIEQRGQTLEVDSPATPEHRLYRPRKIARQYRATACQCH